MKKICFLCVLMTLLSTSIVFAKDYSFSEDYWTEWVDSDNPDATIMSEDCRLNYNNCIEMESVLYRSSKLSWSAEEDDYYNWYPWGATNYCISGFSKNSTNEECEAKEVVGYTVRRYKLQDGTTKWEEQPFEVTKEQYCKNAITTTGTIIKTTCSKDTQGYIYRLRSWSEMPSSYTEGYCKEDLETKCEGKSFKRFKLYDTSKAVCPYTFVVEDTHSGIGAIEVTHVNEKTNETIKNLYYKSQIDLNNCSSSVTQTCDQLVLSGNTFTYHAQSAGNYNLVIYDAALNKKNSVDFNKTCSNFPPQILFQTSSNKAAIKEAFLSGTNFTPVKQTEINVVDWTNEKFSVIVTGQLSKGRQFKEVRYTIVDMSTNAVLASSKLFSAIELSELNNTSNNPKTVNMSIPYTDFANSQTGVKKISVKIVDDQDVEIVEDLYLFLDTLPVSYHADSSQNSFVYTGRDGVMYTGGPKFNEIRETIILKDNDSFTTISPINMNNVNHSLLNQSGVAKLKYNNSSKYEFKLNNQFTSSYNPDEPGNVYNGSYSYNLVFSKRDLVGMTDTSRFSDEDVEKALRTKQHSEISQKMKMSIYDKAGNKTTYNFGSRVDWIYPEIDAEYITTGIELITGNESQYYVKYDETATMKLTITDEQSGPGKSSNNLTDGGYLPNASHYGAEACIIYSDKSFDKSDDFTYDGKNFFDWIINPEEHQTQINKLCNQKIDNADSVYSVYPWEILKNQPSSFDKTNAYEQQVLLNINSGERNKMGYFVVIVKYSDRVNNTRYANVAQIAAVQNETKLVDFSPVVTVFEQNVKKYGYTDEAFYATWHYLKPDQDIKTIKSTTNRAVYNSIVNYAVAEADGAIFGTVYNELNPPISIIKQVFKHLGIDNN